jgi:hypothetical protein
MSQTVLLWLILVRWVLGYENCSNWIKVILVCFKNDTFMRKISCVIKGNKGEISILSWNFLLYRSSLQLLAKTQHCFRNIYFGQGQYCCINWILYWCVNSHRDLANFRIPLVISSLLWIPLCAVIAQIFTTSIFYCTDIHCIINKMNFFSNFYLSHCRMIEEIPLYLDDYDK